MCNKIDRNIYCYQLLVFIDSAAYTRPYNRSITGGCLVWIIGILYPPVMHQISASRLGYNSITLDGICSQFADKHWQAGSRRRREADERQVIRSCCRIQKPGCGFP